ncbi:hypothetical protein V6N13_068722 [Hibiscus sabdariffa]|uniref:U1-C C2H2-type zinc finger domain-containing protein n=1 Tax=Hibiscus sabdariffa TaxID=183260 RepID=A0ABR2QNG8_9ROSI
MLVPSFSLPTIPISILWISLLVFKFCSYYCDYCDTYLTHDSQQTQRIKEHLGQAAAFEQVGAAFNQHLMAQRPRLPVMPIPGAVNQPMVPLFCRDLFLVLLLIPGTALVPVNQPLVPGISPHSLPRPFPNAPCCAPTPGMPPMMAPPGAPFPGQVNGLSRPPTLATSSNGTPTTTTSEPNQVNAHAQPSEANH